MSWNYSGDPADSDLDAVRFYVQDTRSDFPLLSDEEIEFILEVWYPLYSSTIYCAAICAEILASKFAREVSVSADGVNVGANELQQKYKTLAEDLRDQFKASEVAGGGAEIPAEHWDNSWDTSILSGIFALGMHDNIYAGRQEFGGRIFRELNPEQ